MARAASANAPCSCASCTCDGDALCHFDVRSDKTLGHALSLSQPLTQLPWALQINGDAPASLLESDRALATLQPLPRFAEIVDRSDRRYAQEAAEARATLTTVVP